MNNNPKKPLDLSAKKSSDMMDAAAVSDDEQADQDKRIKLPKTNSSANKVRILTIFFPVDVLYERHLHFIPYIHLPTNYCRC
jgi:hypothetical protein